LEIRKNRWVIPRKRLVVFGVFISTFLLTGVAQYRMIFTPEMQKKVESRYGKKAAENIVEWRELLDDIANEDVEEKLYQVNRYFNRFKFVDDIEHWRTTDYWATPIEFISTGAGDCEDYSIAKYFSLRELGIPEENLRLMYVTALRQRQPHMVLAYYPTPKSIPLVLDNINKRILPANKRRDLAPVYSFNGNGLWTAKSMGTGKKLRGSGPMKLWDDMIDRLNTSINGDT
tara:strand:- start:3995 stop:4684 length:690 start_codon:yes stop_codon:yes gene_type:complete